jgi:hypothetical protein
MSRPTADEAMQPTFVDTIRPDQCRGSLDQQQSGSEMNNGGNILQLSGDSQNMNDMIFSDKSHHAAHAAEGRSERKEFNQYKKKHGVALRTRPLPRRSASDSRSLGGGRGLGYA